MKILTSARHLFTDVYIVAHGGKRRVHRQRDPPSVQGRFFQDQFFFNTARQSALHEVVSAEPDNGRCRRGSLRGLVFHWYCIVNSRPKSHSDSQPTPLRSILLPSSPIFVILSLPLTPFTSLLPLYSMAILSLSFTPFRFVYRIAKLFTRGASRKLGELKPPSAVGLVPIASVCSHLSWSRAWISHLDLFTGSLCINYIVCILCAIPDVSSFRMTNHFFRVRSAISFHRIT